MSFYTSLTGLNAAAAQLSVTSNNIANVGTTGFKRSRADFGDIFATSPLQKASSVIGQGVALKQVSQEFSQGNIAFSANSLDIAITGDGFFPLKSADGLQDIYTRNGTFMLDGSYNVVNSAGQALIAAAVDSSGKANMDSLSKLLIPNKTTGDAVATTQVSLGLNLPSDAQVPTLPFNKNDPTTYNKTTAVTVYDSGGNSYLATVYYRKSAVATTNDPTNKWQTYAYIGDTKLDEQLIQAKDKNSQNEYVNKYGEVRSESDIPPQDIARGVTKLFDLNDLKNPQGSTAASVAGGILTTDQVNSWKSGLTFPDQTQALVAGSGVQGTVFSPANGATGYQLTYSTTDVSGVTTQTKIPADPLATPAMTLDDLSTQINADTTLKFTSNLNAAGDLVLIPADGSTTVPPVSLNSTVPSFTQTLVPTSVASKAISFKGDSNAKAYSLKLDGVAFPASGLAGSLADFADPNSTVGQEIVTAGYTATYEAGTNSLTLSLPNTSTSSMPQTNLTASYFDSNNSTQADFTDITPTAPSTIDGYTLTIGAATIPATGSVPLTDFADPTTLAGGALVAAGYSASYNNGVLTVNPSSATDNTLATATLNALVNDNAAPLPVITPTPLTLAPTVIVAPLATYTQAINSQQDAIKFDLNVDGASGPITIDMSYLNNLVPAKKFTGVEMAAEMTNAINNAFGDQHYFKFGADNTTTSANLFRLNVGGTEAMISLTKGEDGVTDLSQMTTKQAVAAIQAEVNKVTTFPSAVTVGYDPAKQTFTFKSANDASISIRSATQNQDPLFGLSDVSTPIDTTTHAWGQTVLPNGAAIIDPANQRFGVEVKFDDAKGVFTIASGTTGDTSSIKLSNGSAMANVLFGVQENSTGVMNDTSSLPLRGIASQPAVLSGDAIGINLDNKFRVDASNNQFVVTVDNVTSLVTMPPKADYTIEDFRKELETRINSMADSYGRTVNGVKVEIATQPGTNNKYFKFSTGTTGDNSFLKVSANSIWGLANLPSARGTTSQWQSPPQAKNADGFPLYVDRNGQETSDPGTFSEDETRNLWSPIFLTKGELTFDSSGTIKSPLESINFKSTTIGASGATIQFGINYGSSTQYSSPFSVIKQDQNGRPEGDLIGVDIADNGLVSASYSNGSQKSLAKIILANFASPTGLRQIGDSSYYATSKSGNARYGEAGAAGFGTVRAGARERANVDLTAELVELITAQRNFQANAKAIETNNTLTQAIINIRS